MQAIDFQKKNNAHGMTGVKFTTIDEYIKTIGFLSNPKHHSATGNNIRIYKENNQKSGAHAPEWRIAFYGDKKYLQKNLNALHQASSAGVGKITLRINSIEFILHLQKVYGFIESTSGAYTEEITPSNSLGARQNILIKLEEFIKKEFPNYDVSKITQIYHSGYSL